MTTYYVTPVADGGSDGANGTSQLTPWATTSKVNGSSFSQDDVISFKCGELWREQLTFPSSGSSGHPITVRNYGAGALPIFYGSDNRSTAGDWTNESGTDWYTTMAVTANIVWRNDVALTQVATKVGVTDATKWWWDSGNSRVYTYGASNPTTGGIAYEIGQRTPLYVTAKNFVTMYGLASYYSNDYGIWFNSSCQNGTVSGCTVYRTYYSGIYFNGALNASVSYNTVSYTGKSASAATLDHAGIALTLATGSVAAAYIGYNTVSHTGRTGITIYDAGMDNTVIEFNEVHDTAENEFDTTAPGPHRLGYGIQLYNGGLVNAIDGVIVRWNNVHDTAIAGVALLGLVTNAVVHHNLLIRNYNTGAPYQNDYLTNIVIFDIGTGSKFYHNTCVQPDVNLALNLYNIRIPAGATFNNGEVKNNIFYNGQQNTFFGGIFELATGSSPLPSWNFNCYWMPVTPQGSILFNWDGTNYTWAGRPTGAMEAFGLNVDPQFVSAATDSYVLKSTSQCVNGGLAIAGINDGYIGAAPDLGVFERNPMTGHRPWRASVRPRKVWR